MPKRHFLPPTLDLGCPYVSGGLAEVSGVESLRRARASQGILSHVIYLLAHPGKHNIRVGHPALRALPADLDDWEEKLRPISRVRVPEISGSPP